MARAGGSTSTISRSIRKRRERGLGRQQHRHDHRVDSETPRARLRQGVALAQTQLAWHSGTISESMSDATSGARAGRRHDRRSAYRRDGAGPERVLAWQRGSAVFECGGTASAAWAGSSAGTIIGSIRGRHERGLGRQFFGTISRSNAEAPRARLGQVVAPARSSDRFGGRSTMVTSA